MEEEIEKRTIFVIMPFTQTPSRGTSELNSFFDFNLKHRIEETTFGKVRFLVKRSDDRFDITKGIIQDVYQADIVICDLSGIYANPNVMYELGVRLSISNRPVILIREANPENKRIFDINTFHVMEYSPLKYPELEDFLIEKIGKLAASQETFRSPVLDIVGKEPSVVSDILRFETVNRLAMARTAINGVRRLFAAWFVAYVSERSDAKFSGNLNDFNKEIVQQKDVLAKLDWSQFKFVLRPNPAIDALIVQPPSIDLFPPTALSFFKTYVLEFYNWFYSTDTYWANPTFVKVLYFASEVYRILDLLAIVATFVGGDLNANKVDQKELLQDFVDLLKDSMFVNQLTEEAM